jgi:hypothetical protein
MGSHYEPRGLDPLYELDSLEVHEAVKSLLGGPRHHVDLIYEWQAFMSVVVSA